MALLARLPKPRFTLARGMQLVVTTAVVSALYAKARLHPPMAGLASLLVDAPILFVLAVVLTALAFGGLKGHTPGQMMLQLVLACLGFLAIITLAEGHWERPCLYAFEVGFGLQVTLPLLARRSIKAGMPRGPRRDWWKGTTEAVVFSFLTMMMVLAGVMTQVLVAALASTFLKF